MCFKLSQSKGSEVNNNNNDLLQPEHVLLLGVVRGHGGLGVGEVHRQLAPVRVVWLASVGFLVLVEHNLSSLQHNTQLFPGSKKNKIGIKNVMICVNVGKSVLVFSCCQLNKLRFSRN